MITLNCNDKAKKKPNRRQNMKHSIVDNFIVEKKTLTNHIHLSQIKPLLIAHCSLILTLDFFPLNQPAFKQIGIKRRRNKIFDGKLHI